MTDASHLLQALARVERLVAGGFDQGLALAKIANLVGVDPRALAALLARKQRAVELARAAIELGES